MYAIIKTGGKQYKVSEGDVITVEKLAQAEGEAVVFDQVLAVVNDGDVKVGKPVVEGVKSIVGLSVSHFFCGGSGNTCIDSDMIHIFNPFLQRFLL